MSESGEQSLVESIEDYYQTGGAEQSGNFKNKSQTPNRGGNVDSYEEEFEIEEYQEDFEQSETKSPPLRTEGAVPRQEAESNLNPEQAKDGNDPTEEEETIEELGECEISEIARKVSSKREPPKKLRKSPEKEISSGKSRVPIMIVNPKSVSRTTSTNEREPSLPLFKPVNIGTPPATMKRLGDHSGRKGKTSKFLTTANTQKNTKRGERGPIAIEHLGAIPFPVQSYSTKGSKGNKISCNLDNFDPFNKHSLLDSPRSLAACKKLGVLPQDLFHIPIPTLQKQIKDEYYKKDTEYLQLKYQQKEERRKSILKKVQKLRSELELNPMSAQEKSCMSVKSFASQNLMPMHSVCSVSERGLIKKEEKILSVLKKKHEMELETIQERDHRLRSLERDQRARQDIVLLQRKKISQELAKKHKLDEEKKKNKSFIEQEIESRNEYQNKRLEEKLLHSQRKVLENKQRFIQAKQEASKQKDDQRKTKLEEDLRAQLITQIEKNQQIRGSLNPLVKGITGEDKKVTFRSKKFEQMIDEKKQKQQKKQIIQDHLALLRNQIHYEQTETQRKIFDDKLIKSEEKRRQQQFRDLRKRIENKKKYENKVQEIEIIKEQEKEKLEDKRDFFMNELENAENRRKYLVQNNFRIMQSKIFKEKSLIEKRDRKIEQFKELEEIKRNKIENKLKISDNVFEAIQKKKFSDSELKRKKMILKMEDRKDNIIILQRMQEYEKSQMLEKIIEKDNREFQRNKEKDAMLIFRQRLRKQYLTAKHQLQDDFDVVKTGYNKSLGYSVIGSSNDVKHRSKSITPYGGKKNVMIGGSAGGTVTSGKNSTPSLNKSSITYASNERGVRSSAGKKEISAKKLGKSDLIILPVGGSNLDSESDVPQGKIPNNYMYRGSAASGVYSLAKKRKSAVGLHNLNRNGKPKTRMEKTCSITELQTNNEQTLHNDQNKTNIFDDPYADTLQRDETEDPLNLTPNPIYVEHNHPTHNRAFANPDPVIKRINEIKTMENTKLKKIQEMRKQQNKKLKLLIEAEQESENKREEMLRVEQSPTMKIKLEKKFIIERAQATSKINNLSDFQEEELRRLLQGV